MNILIQFFGLLALLSWVSSVQWKSKSGILKLQILASVFYCLHYSFLDAYSAAAVSVVSILRLLTIFIIEKKGNRPGWVVLALFEILLVVVAVFTFNGALSLIPIIITALYTYSTWQSNTKILRIVFFIGGWLWIYFNYNVGSFVLIIGNSLEIISSAVSYIRFDIKNKKLK